MGVIIDWADEGFMTAQATSSSDTVRQQIVAVVAARLATITIANGYRTDIGGNVEEWDLTPLDQALETTILEYRDTDEDRIGATVGQQDMVLTVEARIRTVATTPMAEMRKMIADAVKCLADPDNDPTLGGLANDVNVDGAVIVAKGQAADTAAGAVIKFKIEYSVDRGES